MSTGGTPPMSDAEKVAALVARGLAVDPVDGRVYCVTCNRDAVWLTSAKAGETALAGCPGNPPCSVPRIRRAGEPLQ